MNIREKEFDKFIERKEELWGEFEKSLDEKTLFEVLKFGLCFESLERFRFMGDFEDKFKLEGMSRSNLQDLTGNAWDLNLTTKIFKKW